MNCAIKTCTNKTTHSTIAHKCSVCKSFGHSCNEVKYTHGDDLELAEVRKLMKDKSGKIYAIIYHGMGYYSYYKRNNSRDSLNI